MPARAQKNRLTRRPESNVIDIGRDRYCVDVNPATGLRELFAAALVVAAIFTTTVLAEHFVRVRCCGGTLPADPDGARLVEKVI